MGVFALEVLLRIESDAEPRTETGEYAEDPGVLIFCWLIFRFSFAFGVAKVESFLGNLSACSDSSSDGDGLFAGTILEVVLR